MADKFNKKNYLEHWVFSKVLSVIHTEEGAADVTQQTFVRAYESIKRTVNLGKFYLKQQRIQDNFTTFALSIITDKWNNDSVITASTL